MGVAAMGCVPAIDSTISENRNRIVSEVEPKDPMTLTEAKTALAEEADVVLIGRLGTGGLDPFDKKKAIFVLSEAPKDHGDGKSHDASECPFCKRRAEEAPLAQIEFQDPAGKTIDRGAEELFGLKPGQVVVVEGRGLYDSELDTLMITGKKLYIHP